MKKLIIVAALGSLASLSVGCDDAKKEGKKDAKSDSNKDAKADSNKDAADPPDDAKAGEPPAPTLEMAPLEIATEVLTATVSAPKGATAKEEFGSIEVKLADGKDFWIQLSEIDAKDDTTVASMKAEAEGNTVQKVKKIHTESEDTLVYETEFSRRTSVFGSSIVEVGDKKFRCDSGRGGNTYTKAQIDIFMEACKSVKPKA